MADDLFKYFRVEAREILDQLARGALDLERSDAVAAVMPHMLRLAHTMKGAARVVKQREIADLAHALEDTLGPFRAADAPVPRPTVDVVLQLLDSMRARAAALGEPGSAAAGGGKTAPSPGGARVPEATAGSSLPSPASSAPTAPTAGAWTEEPVRTLQADVDEIDGLLEGIAEAHGQLALVRNDLGMVTRMNRLAELLADHLAAPRASAQSAPSPLAAAKMLSLAEELRGMLASFERTLSRGVAQVDRELVDLRQIGERLRLLPAGSMLDRVERAVRDAALQLGRDVRFEGRGRDVRLDADVLRVVQSALVQAARNAVAHGVEPEHDRRAADKPPHGTVTVEIERRGSRVVFRCRDDGRGIDVEAVRTAAAARGIAVPAAVALDAAALGRLLLTAGISTSTAVTTVAGRGIGLDVIREAASRLRGEIRLHTQAGRGTSLEIDLPVSLSSIEALVVAVADRTAAIPLDAVRRTIRLTAADIARTADGEAIAFEGQLVPFVPLARPLRVQAPTGGAARSWSAVVIERGGVRAAFGADRLVATETVIVRPLPPDAPADPVVAGASIDAEGKPQVVLSAEALLEVVARLSAPPVKAASAPRPILVIDDSLTTRMLEQSILELAGYEVEVASSAEEGLEKARLRPYALFLVDVEMPGIDGFTFVAQTRADPALQKVPAVLVTSRDAPEDRRRGLDAGASAYIVKSEFDQNELLDRIRRLVA
jgi:two-component system chemotaxis sensor kinase CheA